MMPNAKPPSDQPSNPTVLRIPPTRPISAIVGCPPRSSVSAGRNRGGGFRHDQHPAVPSAENRRLREVHMADYHWTGGDLPTFVTHLECSLTGERYPADTVQRLSTAGRPLLVRYDLDGARRAFPREALARRRQTLWRYRELLP